MIDVVPMKRIGILGGSSDQATADYYRRLNRAIKDRAGGLNTAELLINSMNFALAARGVKENRWDELGDYLAERALWLERAGADLLICVSNTLHTVSERFIRDVRIPFLHIVDPTAQAICAQGFGRVGLLGTQAVMSGTHAKHRFWKHFGIDVVVPDELSQRRVDEIIFNELCAGEFNDQARHDYLRIIARLHQQGAQGVILGCTEIPLLIQQHHCPDIPLWDMTALHVDKAVELVLS